MIKCATKGCKNKVSAIRYNGLCDTCAGKLWCKEHGHDFENITETNLDSAVYLTFLCGSCGIERMAYVVPSI